MDLCQSETNIFARKNIRAYLWVIKRMNFEIPEPGGWLTISAMYSFRQYLPFKKYYAPICFSFLIVSG
ncbi:hypothetical protein ABW11_22105 [Pluralibacter gergoviae]|uniref:Uncharacterized protein n=1 Tax=Pluralibacter gergoviae TaxID=61647 RepID=A0A0J5NRH6_PLUGE|nr:hypothetical protein A8H26_11185 [Pluralibacter gergoviae]KMK02268.1 hypothetical protein ABW08_19370 [Pluralibacter gergoviae]KMK10977.1 hypothetical protein ABW07_02335 [Pluralibacter gergoviae]KMK14056.1 hypothetical protein ABW06_09245 [Pluralibacter gergoviae]KMK22469.1 hypothetical protein ABW11_22105 [Pluralibacter gergoviae]